MSDTANNTTQLLSEIIQEISSLITVEEIVEKVYERVNALMDASVFAIGVHLPETHQLCYVADMEKGQRLPVNHDSLDDVSRLSVRCFNTRKEIIINDIYKEYNIHFPGQTMPAPNAGEQPDSVIYVPLLIRSHSVGVLTVQSFVKNTYTKYHLDILRGLAASIAGALERARLYGNMEEEVYMRTLEVTKQKEEIETTYNNVKLLSQVGQQITSCLTVEKIIETTYENINQLMDASSFWIGIYNEEEQRLNYPMGKEKGKNVGSASYELTENDRLPVWAFKNQKEVFVNDYLTEYKRYISDYEPAKPIAGEMPVSSIWLPLVSKDKKTMGIITIQSFEKDAYTEYHLNIVRNLAVFTSIALENALMYEQVEQKVKERTAEVVQQKEEIEVTYQNVKILSEIGQQITSCLSVEKILELTYENVNLLMDAPVFWIGIYNKEGNCLDFPGAIEKGEKMPFFSIGLEDDTRLATVCYNEKKNILINDLPKEYNVFLPKVKTFNVVIGEAPFSIIYLPLISKEKKQVGVISVQSFSKNAYTNYDIDILNSLAVFVNIALENALMYEDVEQKVVERTAQVVKQKEELEEKNKDITDSINYAKRIQEAILPSLEMREELFPESFILYHPRDIVSGDFYWFAEKNGKKLIAAVDCTGHGVPGAFMSMIGNSFLNEIVNERALTRPGLILDKLRNLVIRSLKQSEAENGANDGMDISLMCLSENKSDDGTKIKVDWAGANNPLWLMRDGKCIEYKPDKRPISFSRGQELSFTNHGIEVQKGDTLYIFTDGFADQFGGEKGKKFKYKQLQQVLLGIQNESMQKQHEILSATFKKWKGTLEQVDDVLVIGVRV
jgi:GAF domain-containing protein/serine phosphatase RsbU (regulator of sigma subunit)